MSGVLVRPVDWVSFGPPRGMNAGDLHRRSTDFPPTPTAFQGILRTALLRAAGMDLESRTRASQEACAALVGGPDALPDGWQIRGPFAMQIAEHDGERVARPWVPAPRYVLKVPPERTQGYAVQDPPPRIQVSARPVRSPRVEDDPAAINDGSPAVEPLLLGRPELEAQEPLGGWLSPRGLWNVLSGAGEGLPWEREHSPVLPPFVRRQALPGLAIDADTGSAADGMLFLGEVLRFAGSSGFGGWLTGFLPSGIPADALARGDLASCGWRSRPAALEALPRIDPDWRRMQEGHHLPAGEIPEHQGFFLVSLTPVRCARGVSPEAAIEEEIRAHAGVPASVRVRVLASLTGRPRVVGGLEAASRRPRPNRSCWDAGSAWLFVLQGGTDDERVAALRALHDRHPIGPRNEASFGYGHTVVGLGPRV